jgi:hypothetical protein
MNPAFKAGVVNLFKRHAPLIIGGVGGALIGAAVSPEGDRWRHVASGAVIGAGLGYMTRSRLGPRWHGAP